MFFWHFACTNPFHKRNAGLGIFFLPLLLPLPLQLMSSVKCRTVEVIYYNDNYTKPKAGQQLTSVDSVQQFYNWLILLPNPRIHHIFNFDISKVFYAELI